MVAMEMEEGVDKRGNGAGQIDDGGEVMVVAAWW